MSQPLHLILPLWAMLAQCEVWGGATDSAMTERGALVDATVGLDEGIARGSGGAEVAPADGFAKPVHGV